MPAAIRRALPILAGLILLAGPAAAQIATSGRITGRVINGETGLPIERVEVQVVGTLLRAFTDLDGRYYVPDVPLGAHTVEIRKIGFTPKNVTNVSIIADETTVLDLSLTSAVFAVEAITVSAEVERGTVNRALEEQRNALNIVNALSAEQITRSPDSDASQAVQRVSGVTVQGGKYVFVRGLGERYTTTSLNGARIPSPEPEKRIVPLDLFPAGLLEAVTTSKTFTPDQPGDFSGGQVDLRTREFPADRVLTFSMSAGLNTAATGRTVVRAPTEGSEWLGYAGQARQLPTAAEDGNGATSAEIMRSFRNVWTADQGSGYPKGSLGLSLGGEDPILGTRLGYIASLTYAFDQEIRQNEARAIAVGDGAGGVRPQNEYAGSTGRTSVLWGGIANLSTRVGGASKLQLNNSYSRSADNEATQLAGVYEEFGGLIDLTRLTFIERSVRSHQLRGEHLLAGRHRFEWAGTYSGVGRNEPDRSDLVDEAVVNPETGTIERVRWSDIRRSATRTFSALDEQAREAGGNLRLAFGDPGRELAIKVGGSYRRVERDADSRAFDIGNATLDPVQREAPAESLFDGRYADGGLRLQRNVIGGAYAATDNNVAGYLQMEIPLGARVRVIGGARVERSQLDVVSESPLGQTSAALDDTDLLPSLAVNLALSRHSNLRASATQTLSRPEYRELSSVGYFDVLGGLSVFGNPNLQRALIQNADLRWETFPNAGEVISVGVFAKRFKNPIEQIQIGATGASTLSWVNAEAAHNYGAELEVRKSLAGLTGLLAPFTLFANTTLMKSDITPGADSLSSLTNSNRPMVGQAEYVVNTGLTYSNYSGSVNATVLYNVVGPRIVEAGVDPRPDTYERERHVLDFSLRLPAFAGLSMKLDAKNLLDAEYRFTQGDVVRHRYTAGRTFALGFSWGAGQ
jgi:TonB dependent receptor/Carboxypeptidase regulatory-like domain/TonB-dependent Receptor Plug Domain